MSENMVRTQVYLPRKTYEALQARGQAEGLTLAEQVRAALENYIWQSGFSQEAGQPVPPDDPIFKLMGAVDSGIDDLGFNHDHYLYGAPKREMPRRIKETTKPATKPSRRPRRAK
jgi:hypothetical protein